MDLILKRFAEAAAKAGKDPETMTKAATFIGGITPNRLPIISNFKSTLSWSRLGSIHEPDPRKNDEMVKTLSDEEALEYCTLVPTVDDLIEVFDSAFKAGMNHVIMFDAIPGFVRLELAPPEAAD